jgi:hypothetical protein
MSSSSEIGIYCLANDNVVEWAVALFESLRVYEPRRRLCVIPFDENVGELRRLSSKYDYTILEDDSLEELDEIGRMFWPDHKGIKTFRKFAAFWGPFRDFLFLDSDIVILGGLEKFCEVYLRREHDLIYFDRDINEVYRPGAFQEKMVREHGAQGFVTGNFFAPRGLFTLDEVRAYAAEAAPHKHELAATFEQPFINYCADVKGVRVASFQDVIPGFVGSWAGLPGLRKVGEEYWLQPLSRDGGSAVPMVHWAGYRLRPSMPYSDVYLQFRMRGIDSKAERLKFKARWLIDDLVNSAKGAVISASDSALGGKLDFLFRSRRGGR